MPVVWSAHAIATAEKIFDAERNPNGRARSTYVWPNHDTYAEQVVVMGVDRNLSVSTLQIHLDEHRASPKRLNTLHCIVHPGIRDSGQIFGDASIDTVITGRSTIILHLLNW